MQNYLYKCDICGIVSCFKENHEEVWFRDCSGCRSLQFHHKIIVQVFGTKDSHIWFNCAMDDEEASDDNKEKG